jgi:hypothetical protein
MNTVAIFCTIDDFCQWFEPMFTLALTGRLRGELDKYGIASGNP